MCSLWMALFLFGIIPDWICSGYYNPYKPSFQLSKPRSRRQGDHISSDTGEAANKTDNDTYYTTSFYTSTEPEETTPPSETSVTTTEKTGPMTTQAATTPKTEGDFDPTSILEDDLTSEAWAAMPNWKELRDEQQKVEDRWWAAYNRDYYEWWRNAYNVWDDNYWYYGWFQNMCFQVGTTLFNAKKHLREYYRIRYAYFNTREFEIGYITHEIVYKYTILLELFHNVQYRYYNQSGFFDIASGSYMVYMYTVILEQSQDIMHYCNILSEIDKKYGATDDNDAKEDLGYSMNAKIQNLMLLEEQRAKQRARLLRHRLRQQRQQQKELGIYVSTRKTRRPRTSKHFPHHYGWSVEYF